MHHWRDVTRGTGGSQLSITPYSCRYCNFDWWSVHNQTLYTVKRIPFEGRGCTIERACIIECPKKLNGGFMSFCIRVVKPFPFCSVILNLSYIFLHLGFFGIRQFSPLPLLCFKKCKLGYGTKIATFSCFWLLKTLFDCRVTVIPQPLAGEATLLQFYKCKFIWGVELKNR